MSGQSKTRHRVPTGLRKRNTSTGVSPLAREQSFYALIEQFWFARKLALRELKIIAMKLKSGGATVKSLYLSLAKSISALTKSSFENMWRKSSKDGRTKKPNPAMQRTASQPAIYVASVCHPRDGCKPRFTGLAVAELVSR